MVNSTTAAVFLGPGRGFELRDVAVPELREGELLVEVTLCTICGSDLHTYAGRRVCECPTILGHEITGRVVETAGPIVDATGSRLRSGDRVTWSIAASCGRCFYCSQQIPQKCEHLVKYGHEPLATHGPVGGLAQHCRLAAGTTMCRIPDSLDETEVCPASCCTATAAAALRTAGEIAGRSLVVLGAGSLGLTAAAMGLDQQSEFVCLADVDAARLKRAAALDVEAFPVGNGYDPLKQSILDRTDGRGVDVVLEMTGSSDAAEFGVDALRIGGTLILVGAVFPDRALELPAEKLVRRLLRIEGVHNYRPQDLVMALAFLEATGRGSPVRTLVEREFALDAVNEAFQFALDNRPLRIAVRP